MAHVHKRHTQFIKRGHIQMGQKDIWLIRSWHKREIELRTFNDDDGGGLITIEGHRENKVIEIGSYDDAIVDDVDETHFKVMVRDIVLDFKELNAVEKKSWLLAFNLMITKAELSPMEEDEEGGTHKHGDLHHINRAVFTNAKFGKNRKSSGKARAPPTRKRFSPNDAASQGAVTRASAKSTSTTSGSSSSSKNFISELSSKVGGISKTSSVNAVGDKKVILGVHDIRSAFQSTYHADLYSRTSVGDETDDKDVPAYIDSIHESDRKEIEKISKEIVMPTEKTSSSSSPMKRPSVTDAVMRRTSSTVSRVSSSGSDGRPLVHNLGSRIRTPSDEKGLPSSPSSSGNISIINYHNRDSVGSVSSRKGSVTTAHDRTSIASDRSAGRVSVGSLSDRGNRISLGSITDNGLLPWNEPGKLDAGGHRASLNEELGASATCGSPSLDPSSSAADTRRMERSASGAVRKQGGRVGFDSLQQLTESSSVIPKPSSSFTSLQATASASLQGGRKISGGAGSLYTMGSHIIATKDDRGLSAVSEASGASGRSRGESLEEDLRSLRPLTHMNLNRASQRGKAVPIPSKKNRPSWEWLKNGSNEDRVIMEDINVTKEESKAKIASPKKWSVSEKPFYQRWSLFQGGKSGVEGRAGETRERAYSNEGGDARTVKQDFRHAFCQIALIAAETAKKDVLGRKLTKLEQLDELIGIRSRQSTISGDNRLKAHEAAASVLTVKIMNQVNADAALPPAVSHLLNKFATDWVQAHLEDLERASFNLSDDLIFRVNDSFQTHCAEIISGALNETNDEAVRLIMKERIYFHIHRVAMLAVESQEKVKRRRATDSARTEEKSKKVGWNLSYYADSSVVKRVRDRSRSPARSPSPASSPLSTGDENEVGPAPGST